MVSTWLFFFYHFIIHLATEIRCQEKSKGGLCYEVILGQPVAIPKQIKSASATKIVSAAEIERKLSEAEKRRLVSSILLNSSLSIDFLFLIFSFVL